MFKAFSLIFYFLTAAFSTEWMIYRQYFLWDSSHPDPTGGWNLNPPSIFLSSVCADKTIMGGFSLFYGSQSIEQTFLYIPSHLSVKIEYTLYLLDNWNSDCMQLTIDGVIVDNRCFSSSALLDIDLCGNSAYFDRTAYIIYQTSHTDSTLNVQIQSQIGQTGDSGNTISWGVYNLTISLEINCPPLCLDCWGKTCYDPVFYAKQDATTQSLSCQQGFYDFQNFSSSYCGMCSQECLTCSDETNCTTCYPEDKFDPFWNKCLPTGTYDQFYNLYDDEAVFYNHWVVNGAIPLQGIECYAQFYFVGSYQQFGPGTSIEQVIEGINPHYTKTFRFLIYGLGNVDGTIIATLDGVQIISLPITTSSGSQYLSTKSCGGYQLWDFQVEAHVSSYTFPSTIVVSLPANAQSGVYYWGIKNFFFRHQTCHVTCKLCSGPGANECTACYNNATLSTQNTCDCNQGFILRPAVLPMYGTEYPCSVCVLPIANCVQDVGISTYHCIQCENASFYLNSDGSQCVACPEFCETCTDANNCLSCKINAQMDNNNMCWGECQPGYFHTTTSYTCYPCDSSCLTCAEISTNCLTCSGSLALHTLQNNGSICLDETCSSGSYFDQTHLQCLPCNTLCQECFGNANNCTSCVSGIVINGQTCLNETCSSGSYFDQTHSQCLPCNTLCQECFRNANNCSSCISGIVINGQTCLNETCSSESYFDQANLQCLPCNTLCQECFGNANNCSSCVSGIVINGQTCLNETCSSGSYFDQAYLQCLPCNTLCQECSQNPNQCTLCGAGFILHNSVCINTNCVIGSYFDQSLFSCQICDTNCYECSMSASTCISCQSPFVLSVNNCVLQTCSSGFYLNLGDSSCYPCNADCEQCVNSPSYCVSCPNGFSLNGNQCSPDHCSNGYYFHSSNSQCQKCNDICLECFGNESNCTVCKAPLILSGSTCIACPPKFYFDFLSHFCQPCNDSCLECSEDSNNCLTCDFNLNLTGNKCFNKSCPDGYYFDELRFECIECDSSCLTCLGEAKICTSCHFVNQDHNNLTLNRIDNTCDKVEIIKPMLSRNYSDSDGVSYSLIFINFPPLIQEEFFNKRPFQLNISNFEDSEYNFTFQNSTNLGIFKFIFSSIREFNESNILTIYLSSSFFAGFQGFALTTDWVSTSFVSSIKMIVPTLKKKPLTSLILYLSFSDDYPLLFINIQNIIILEISNFDRRNFDFSIATTENPLVFTIKLNYSGSLLGTHHLNLGFNLDSPDFDIIPYKISTKNLNTQLENYYILSSSEASFIEAAKTTADVAESFSNKAMPLFVLLNSQSSLIFTAVLLSRYINYLKFINIDYPPNAQAIFQTKLELFSFLPPISFPEQLADENGVDGKFAFYAVDNMVLNNLAKSLLEKLISFLFILFLLFLKKKIDKLPNRYKLITLVFNRVYSVLCWNSFIINIITLINDLFFYSLVNLTFPYNGSDFGRLNYATSLFAIFFALFFWGFLNMKLTLIRKILFNTSDIIFPTLSMKNKVFPKAEEPLTALSQLTKDDSPQKMKDELMIQMSKGEPYLTQSTKENQPTTLITTKEEQATIGEMVKSSQNYLLENLNKESENLNAKGSKNLKIKEPENLDVIDANEKKPENLNSRESEHFNSKEIDINDKSQLSSDANTKTASSPKKISVFDSEKTISFPAHKISLKNVLNSVFRKKNHVIPFEIPSTSTSPAKVHIKRKHSEGTVRLLESYKVLYNDFHQESILKSRYFLIDILKYCIIIFEIVLDRAAPLRQLIIISSLSVVMFIALILVRSFKARSTFIINILYQLATVLCTFSALALALCDQEENYDQNLRFDLGKAMVLSCVLLFYLIALIMIVSFSVSLWKIGKFIYSYFEERVKRRRQSKFRESIFRNSIFPANGPLDESRPSILQPNNKKKSEESKREQKTYF